MSNRIRIMIFTALFTVQPLMTRAAPVDVNGDGKVGPHEAIDLSAHWKGPAAPLGGVQPWQIDGATIFYNTGKVGIGSATPHHQLRISGGPAWTSNGWMGSLELDNATAIGWRANAAGQRFGIGQSGGGLYFFRTDSDPGSASSEAKYAMTITDAGSVGIGTTAPDTKFQVNDGRFRLRESATLERWDLFYDPPSEKFYLQENAAFNHLVFTKGPNPRVGVGIDSPAAKLHVVNSAGDAILGNAPNGNGVVGCNALSGNAATAGINSAQDGVGIFGQAELGSSAIGVYGSSASGIGTLGVSTINVGVKGTSNSNIGVQGVSTSSSGVEGRSDSSEGVYGYSDSSSGVRGYSGNDFGVVGESGGGIFTGGGVRGVGYNGVEAISNHSNGTGLYAKGGFWAAEFEGSVEIRGNLQVRGNISEIKSTDSVQIDHPLDPENKFLFHSSVESSEMKNVYDGVAVTDAIGYAEVALPDWFEALNSDFRYQLTVIDEENSNEFVQAKIVKTIKDNHFTIRTSRPDVEVSWLVTGVRQDPWAKTHPIEVEKTKSDKERGKYLSPEIYGQPREKGIHYRPELEIPSEVVSKIE